jgi:WD40 repeat protein
VDWSCDGRRLASGSYDKTVCIFTLGTERLTKEHVFKGHGDSVDQLCWHPNKADMLATASGDKTVGHMVMVLGVWVFFMVLFMVVVLEVMMIL